MVINSFLVLCRAVSLSETRPARRPPGCHTIIELVDRVLVVRWLQITTTVVENTQPIQKKTTNDNVAAWYCCFLLFMLASWSFLLRASRGVARRRRRRCCCGCFSCYDSACWAPVALAASNLYCACIISISIVIIYCKAPS